MFIEVDYGDKRGRGRMKANLSVYELMMPEGENCEKSVIVSKHGYYSTIDLIH